MSNLWMRFRAVDSAARAAKMLGVELPGDVLEVEKEYPVFISEYYLNLIDRNDPINDPVWKQCMPSAEELRADQLVEDGLGEEPQSPLPHMIHRYYDRVVVLATGRCAMRCRFCFRKRTWRNGAGLDELSNGELDEICCYLAGNPQVREVLVSGGDPLMLSTSRLEHIVRRLFAVKSIETVRIGSRVPVTLPERIDDELVDMLGDFPGIWLMTHFNHPRELTAAAAEACKKFIRRGIPVLNQTVLLKGINDDAVVLEELFRGLVKIRVKPHYLFHVDPIKGAGHFATGIECGLNMLRVFRSRLSSLAVPTFAIDLPEGGGKVALQPDYSAGNCFKSINGGNIPYYTVE